jgi:hypothetical protein
VLARGKSDDQKSRSRITEGFDRSAMVVPVLVLDGVEEPRQPLATAACGIEARGFLKPGTRHFRSRIHPRGEP